MKTERKRGETIWWKRVSIVIKTQKLYDKEKEERNLWLRNFIENIFGLQVIATFCNKDRKRKQKRKMTPQMSIKLGTKYVYCVLYSHYVHSVLYCFFILRSLTFTQWSVTECQEQLIIIYTRMSRKKNCLKSNLLCIILKYGMRKVITHHHTFTPTHILLH